MDKNELLIANKLLRKLCIEKQKLTLEELVEKYNLSKKIKKQAKNEYANWNITDLWIILDILKISMYDFMVMFEEENKTD